jgi:hypothetical protein
VIFAPKCADDYITLDDTLGSVVHREYLLVLSPSVGGFGEFLNYRLGNAQASLTRIAQ